MNPILITFGITVLMAAIIAVISIHFIGKMMEDDPQSRPSKLLAACVGSVAGAILFLIQFTAPFLLPTVALLVFGVAGATVMKLLAGVRAELAINAIKAEKDVQNRKFAETVKSSIRQAHAAFTQAQNTLIGDSSREKDLWQARYENSITNKAEKNIEKAEWKLNKKARQQESKSLTVEQFFPAL
jgi:hypothetical protein